MLETVRKDKLFDNIKFKTNSLNFSVSNDSLGCFLAFIADKKSCILPWDPVWDWESSDNCDSNI